MSCPRHVCMPRIQMKEKFEKYKASLNRLLADKEKDLDTKKGLKHRTKLGMQLHYENVWRESKPSFS